LLRGILAIVKIVIVVDDGSTDATPEVLSALPEVTVIRHCRNRGKGVALRTGLARAAEMGFTHAITMDGDGQHVACDLPRFLQAIHEDPEALVLGVRNLGMRDRRFRKSRLLRANSNWWVWLETGVRTGDSQSGFRAYPLQPTCGLTLSKSRYDFEIEVLVKLIWAGTRVRTVPVQVRYDVGSRSHFRPFRDFALVSHLNACLIAQRIFLPQSLCAALCQERFRAIPWRRRLGAALGHIFYSQAKAPAAVAAAAGVGVCVGILPIWGFQILTAALLAHWLRLNKAMVIAASNISFPAMVPVILCASLATGRWMLGRPPIQGIDSLIPLPSSAWTWMAEYLLGSVTLAAGAGLVAVGVTYLLARFLGALNLRGGS
jgi:glycosyltransferase involved in cell wall biosynthesis